MTETVYYKVKCECGKTIIVRQELFGVSHTSHIGAARWECLSEQQRRKIERLGVLEETK